MKIFRLTKKYIYEMREKFIIYIMLCIVSGGFSVILPYITGNFVDDLLLQRDVNIIYRYCIILLCVVLLQLLVGYIVSKLYTVLQIKMAYKMNIDVLSHMQKVSLMNLKDINIAYINKNINNDSNALIVFSLTVIQDIVIKSITFMIPITILMKLNIKLTIGCFVILIIYLITYIIVKRNQYENSFVFNEALSRYFASLQEQLEFARLGKIFCVFDKIHLRVNGKYEKLESIAMKQQKINYIYTTVDGLANAFCKIYIYIWRISDFFGEFLNRNVYGICELFFINDVSSEVFF